MNLHVRISKPNVDLSGIMAEYKRAAPPSAIPLAPGVKGRVTRSTSKICAEMD